MNKLINTIISWEMLIFCGYYLLIWYFELKVIDIKFLENSIFSSSFTLLIISLPVIIFGLYIFSKNKDFKSLIGNYINSSWQPALVVSIMILLEIVSIVVGKSIYKSSYYSVTVNKPDFFIYNVIFFWLLMPYIAIYQLFGKFKKALINITLSFLLLVIFLIVCFTGLA